MTVFSSLHPLKYIAEALSQMSRLLKPLLAAEPRNNLKRHDQLKESLMI